MFSLNTLAMITIITGKKKKQNKTTYKDKAKVIETTEFCGLQTFYKLDSDQHVEHSPNKADVHTGKLYSLVRLSILNRLVHLLLGQLVESAVELHWDKHRSEKIL